jgi:hypothetical protein
MSNLPKLKFKLPPEYPPEEPMDMEEAKDRLDFKGGIITVEGQLVRSYNDLLKLANRPEHKNKKFLEVKLQLVIGGG